MDEVAVVVRGGGQGSLVGEELTVEGGESLRRLRSAGGELRRRDPAPEVDVETGDGDCRQRSAQKVAA